MTVKYGEMENLVTPVISIDQYTPKIGEENENVVLAFEVSFERSAKDLSNLIETDIVENLDVDISTGPDEDGKYLVFVEFERNEELNEKIAGIVRTVSNVTGITEWKFNYFKGNETVDLTEENLEEFIITDKEEYVMRNNAETTNEAINRIRHLAGI